MRKRNITQIPEQANINIEPIPFMINTKVLISFNLLPTAITNIFTKTLKKPKHQHLLQSTRCRTHRHSELICLLLIGIPTHTTGPKRIELSPAGSTGQCHTIRPQSQTTTILITASQFVNYFLRTQVRSQISSSRSASTTRRASSVNLFDRVLATILNFPDGIFLEETWTISSSPEPWTSRASGIRI